MTRGVTVGEPWAVVDLATDTVVSRHLTYGDALRERQPLQDVQYRREA